MRKGQRVKGVGIDLFIRIDSARLDADNLGEAGTQDLDNWSVILGRSVRIIVARSPVLILYLGIIRILSEVVMYVDTCGETDAAEDTMTDLAYNEALQGGIYRIEIKLQGPLCFK